jgi:hypothetical protein
VDSSAILLVSSIAVSIAIAVSGIFPRIRRDWIEGMQHQIEDLEKQIVECRRDDIRRQESLRSAWEYIQWLQHNSVIKAGAPPPPQNVFFGKHEF